MSLTAVFTLALRALLRNKVRTALTMLGIVIGIASVIAMVAIGQGASSMVQNSIASMGRNFLMIRPGAASMGRISAGAGSGASLTPEDGDAILREVPAVEALSPVIYPSRSQVAFGDKNWNPSNFYGVSTAFLSVRDWEVSDGNFFTEHDVAAGAKVCVLGRTVAQNLFESDSPIGKSIRIRNLPFRVAGVLAAKGTNAMGMDQDDIVLIPWTAARRYFQRSTLNSVHQFLVSAVSAAAVEDALREIKALLRQRHRLGESEEDDFNIMTQAEIASMMTQTSRVMTILLVAIASISLVVGGIGIMNIMLVSVVERTREIGLRMAVGARGQDILLQFLAESIVIAIAAGIVGMAIGYGAAVLISRQFQWPTFLSPGSAALAVLFSGGVGVFFGLYPALRASRLDPIEALRYE
ncbi:MAG: ABC transporter permease [Planctomycetota bacterium]